MDDAGNILIRRYSKSNVFVKSTAATSNEETAIGQDILKLPGYSLEQEKIFKVRANDEFVISNYDEREADDDKTMVIIMIGCWRMMIL